MLSKDRVCLRIPVQRIILFYSTYKLIEVKRITFVVVRELLEVEQCGYKQTLGS